MNRARQHLLWPWGVHIALGVVALGGIMGLRSQADDRSSRRSENSQRGSGGGNSNRNTVTPNRSAGASVNTPIRDTSSRVQGSRDLGSRDIGNQGQVSPSRVPRSATTPQANPSSSSGFHPDFSHRSQSQGRTASGNTNTNEPMSTHVKVPLNTGSMSGQRSTFEPSRTSRSLEFTHSADQKGTVPGADRRRSDVNVTTKPPQGADAAADANHQLRSPTVGRTERSRENRSTQVNPRNIGSAVNSGAGQDNQLGAGGTLGNPKASPSRIDLRKSTEGAKGVPSLSGNPSPSGNTEQKIKIRRPSERETAADPATLTENSRLGQTRTRQAAEKSPIGTTKGDSERLHSAKRDSSSEASTKFGARDKDSEKQDLLRNRPEVEKTPRVRDGQTLTREDLKKVKQDLELTQTKLRDGKPVGQIKLQSTPELRKANAERLQKLSREQLRLPVAKNGKIDPVQIERLKIRPAHDAFQNRLQSGELNRFAKLKMGNTFQIQRQFALHRSGDISRRMNLQVALHARGGWRHRHFGIISPLYARHCRGMWYAGPSFCSSYLWYPRWSRWVDWCWWDTCSPICDPRPIFCRPVIYSSCSPWVAWSYPVWQPLPYVSCGSWIDVDPVVINTGADLQLLATRFVDPGHPEQELGPRFRVWFRNNSPNPIQQPFNVMLIAAPDANALPGLPEAGIQVPGLAPGEMQSVDIRLPFAANFLNRDFEGRSIPFSHLHVLVDSHNQIPEVFEANNGATLLRGDILPVDPVVFAAEPARVETHGLIHLAGEGLGPEPGKALVVIDEQEFEAEILGWFDLGVQIRIPNFDLTESTAADLVIVRGDGAASPPVSIEIDPEAANAAADLSQDEPRPEIVAPEFPEPPPLPESIAP